MYKLIAIDLDGTLLNSNGEVSLENKNAIKNAIKKGALVVLASRKNANKYIICGNGTLIYDLQKEKIIYDAFLKKDKVLQIIKICDENSIFYNLYTETSVITKSLNYNVLYYDNENSKKPEEKRTNIDVVEDIYKHVEENENINILKMTICDNDKIIFSGILRKLKEISEIDILEVEHMSRKSIQSGSVEIPIEYYYTEISKQNTDKWTAIEYLLEKLNIKKEEVMAIGDNANDKKMVENAGIGVAMGKSMLEAEQIGDVFVKDNNQDGVAEAINKYINNA